ncbi:acetyl-CoA synthetase-like protein [Trametes coccinea BRFM310]|uniref:Acetyl-CoA synthetase-like protein n=1 Tax=Trametes coccinea (strain BRFM310) TaxID=1353009 RepID=A0A1Y2IAZ6_TRAC3|nr:acetyl-CoA synthetase-like protein [Trametes coccinea BRFM310]
MAAVVTEQGVNHPTFKSPPSDLDLSIPSLYEYHAKNSPTHPVFSYVNTATKAIRDITFAEAWDRINTLIERVYLDYKGSPQNSVSRLDHSRPVIGILAIADQLSYLYLEVAIMSLGYTVFPISSRNSAQVVAHLVEKTAIRLLYVSADSEMQALSNSADKILRERNWQVWMRYMVTPKEYEKEHVPTEANRKVDIGDDDVTMILHSSGTTAFPKPIPVTRRRMINISKIPSFGEVDLAGKRIAAHTNPIYHGMGLATVIWPLTCGATFVLYPPVSPPIIPTPSNFIASWIAGKCDIVFSVPVFIEAWARNPAHIPALSSLDCIVYGGASVNKALGDMLTHAGVTLHSLWGSTEQGPATMFIPKDPPPIDEWEYFKLMPQATYHLEPQPGLKNIYEPIMIANDICAPNVTNMEMNGKPAYAAGDLLEQHPTNPDRWRVYGRKDVQIMLSTGENVNPVPIEEILGEDPHIVVAVMFGRHRIQPGVLIQPTPDHQIPAGDEKKAEQFKNLIWQSVEKANAHSPAYARIERNMIIVTSPDKPLDRTPKGSARHKVCVERYAEEIEKLYAIEEDCELHPELRQFPDRV